MKTALVTGGAGFVGTNLIKRLLKENYKVISLDNYSSGFKSNEQEGCNYIDLDIASKSFKDKIENSDYIEDVDVIFHLAALARIQPSLVDPFHHVNNNIQGCLNILEIARTKNIPVVYAGSSSFHHGLYESPYAWSKWSGEEMCKLYSKVYEVETSICRFYNVYGEHQIESGTYATVIGIFQKQYREKLPLTITGNGEQRRDFTHVNDIVDGLFKCSQHKFYAEIFELGRGENHSINELANYFGKDVEKTYIPARKGEYDITLCDFSKASKLLGYNPQLNLSDYITSIL